MYYVLDERRHKEIRVSSLLGARNNIVSRRKLHVYLSHLWAHSPLSRVVVVAVVDIDAQAARDSTASDTW